MFGWRRRTPALPPVLWQHILQRLPWAARLTPERQRVLHRLTETFLRQKRIVPLQGVVIGDRDRALLAAFCCLPLLEFGAEGLHGWSQLLLYPDAFRVQRSHQDAAGVLHEWQDDLSGEAWEHGPLILSWADVQGELEDPQPGYCVAVHEMAHKLDALDGAMDGTPPLPRVWQRQWAADFQQAYDALCADADAGRALPIDDYACESPEEFFAVCSEYHFTAPDTLRTAMPQVAAHLQRLYGEMA